MKHIPSLLLCFLLSLVGGLQGQGNSSIPIQWVESDNHSFTPKEAFLNPQLLMSYWGNDPIPLDSFTKQEVQIQRLLNEKEDFIVTETPQSEDGSAPLDRDYGLIDQDVITPYTWKWIELKLPRKDGVILTVKLRRPNWWLIQSGLTELGATIPLSLGEMEADGVARLVRIWPNQLDMLTWRNMSDLHPSIRLY
ncbi:MAG: hypothetical protein AAFP00_07455, partial [Bacteroidota bacterium]